MNMLIWPIGYGIVIRTYDCPRIYEHFIHGPIASDLEAETFLRQRPTKFHLFSLLSLVLINDTPRSSMQWQ
jgi:hypothetical protein